MCNQDEGVPTSSNQLYNVNNVAVSVDFKDTYLVSSFS